MEKIESFKVNHLKLKPGLYLSRVDEYDDCEVRTFDVRLVAPNVDDVLGTGCLHTIEHIGATFLRNSCIKDDVVYFGPMGCRTGFYLVLFGDYEPSDLYVLMKELCDYIINFEGDIPGATPIECGNYLDQDLVGAKDIMNIYSVELDKKRFVYSK